MGTITARKRKDGMERSGTRRRSGPRGQGGRPTRSQRPSIISRLARLGSDPGALDKTMNPESGLREIIQLLACLGFQPVFAIGCGKQP